MVFIHGWGLTARTYTRTLQRLARVGARIIAPALPGFGRSAPLPGEYTWEKLANWVDLLLEHAGVEESAYLVGHSFGGGVATATASRFPTRARSLVLVNAVGGSVWKQGRAGERLLADRPLWDWGLRFPTEWVRRDYRRAFPAVARDFLGNVVAHPYSLARAARLARNADLREELTTLAGRGLPISVLWGSQDRVVPEATFLATCEAAGAPGDVIRRGGHSWLLADPEEFGEVVTNSLTIHALIHRRRERAGDAAERTASGPAA